MTSHPSCSVQLRLQPTRLQQTRLQQTISRFKPAFSLATATSITIGTIALTGIIAGTAQAQTAITQTESAQTDIGQTGPSQAELNQTELNQTELNQTELTQPATQPATTQAPGTIQPPADPTPKPTPFEPNIAGVTDLSASENATLGIGHLRPGTTVSEGDAVSWLSSVILPLYGSPGGAHWGWMYQGWLIPAGQAYLAIGRDAGFAMVQSDENLYTFPILEVRDDGWFRVQYTIGGSAWAHTSHLGLGETPLMIENWEDRLANQAAVYFLETDGQPLRSRPEPANNMLSLVPNDSLIEPLDFAGDWMRVRVTRPTAACNPLTGATVTEGWMRWREDNKPLVWYKPDGSCQQG